MDTLNNLPSTVPCAQFLKDPEHFASYFLSVYFSDFQILKYVFILTGKHEPNFFDGVHLIF